jgi:hypothetical protein
MKVVPSQTGEVVAAASAQPRMARTADFGAALAKASTTEGPKPGTDVVVREGEKTKPVEDHAYADIVNGKRKGMYLNTSGNERHGQAFVLARRNGVEYHIYGSGKDRLVVALKPERKPEAQAEAKKPESTPESKSGELKLREGETIEPVPGHAYSEIVSGARSGMYINTTGGARHGEAFVLARRDGVEYHIYGSGKDREVIAVGKRD